MMSVLQDTVTLTTIVTVLPVLVSPHGETQVTLSQPDNRFTIEVLKIFHFEPITSDL